MPLEVHSPQVHASEVPHTRVHAVHTLLPGERGDRLLVGAAQLLHQFGVKPQRLTSVGDIFYRLQVQVSGTPDLDHGPEPGLFGAAQDQIRQRNVRRSQPPVPEQDLLSRSLATRSVPGYDVAEFGVEALLREQT